MTKFLTVSCININLISTYCFLFNKYALFKIILKGTYIILKNLIQFYK